MNADAVKCSRFVIMQQYILSPQDRKKPKMQHCKPKRTLGSTDFHRVEPMIQRSKLIAPLLLDPRTSEYLKQDHG
jgi:hypothetical protein